MKRISSLFFLLLFSVQGFTQAYKNKKLSPEKRAQSLLVAMTLAEKLEYVGGDNYMSIRAVPRLSLPEIKMSDGPVGTRNNGPSTAYPCGILAAASWDTALVYQMGIQLGRDCRSRGIHILLAPGVNIARSPLCGRNFEYFGEDPFLTSRMAVGYIRGVQSQRVAATVKHFAANNQEYDRNNISSDVDERTLREIYLPAFKAAVKDAQVASVMTSYNLLNGIYAAQNSWLNNQVLKKEWGFKGVVTSDWSATYNGIEAANGGLDLEMPKARFMNPPTLLAAMKAGTVSQATIDDKVKRILTVIFRFGFYDYPQTDVTIPKNNPQGKQAALNLARAGIVLLKNEDHLLPLSNKIKKIAVIGPNANEYMAGGGSSHTFPFSMTSTFEGIRKEAKDALVEYIPALPMQADLVKKSIFYTEKGSSIRGLKAEYYNNIGLEGAPALSKIDTFINISNGWRAPGEHNGYPYDHCSMRWSGIIRPVKSGRYKFTIKSLDGIRCWVNAINAVDVWKNQGVRTNTLILNLEAGKDYPVKLESFASMHAAQVSLSWAEDRIDFSEAIAKAKDADAVVICAGFNESNERENADRTFELPENQDSLIKAVASANSKTIVVMNAGGSARLTPWLKDVKSLLYAWYPGQEGGQAVADILFGKVNPSGKLPVSFEKEGQDNPAYSFYHDTDGDKRVQYQEGILVGYRYYDTKKIQPLYPFGYGLSYTKFQYSNLKIEQSVSNHSPSVIVMFTVTNTGNRDGAEVAQLYIGQKNCTVNRPDKELKGFSKVFLNKGESKRVTIKLNKDAFSYYSTKQHAFVSDPGEFQILIGSDSGDIRLKREIVL